jgi:hypothetical protein
MDEATDIVAGPNLLELDALMAGDTFGGRACDEFCGCSGVQSPARHPPLSPASRATGG